MAILGFNSPEWFFANMGAIGAGAKAAGIYTTNGPEAAGYIVNHAKAEVCVKKKSIFQPWSSLLVRNLSIIFPFSCTDYCLRESATAGEVYSPS